MTVGDLIELREATGFTQTAMAKAMHLSLRSYQEIESGAPVDRLTGRQRMLAERASLTIAVGCGKIDLALPAIRREAMDLVGIFRGELIV